MKQKAVHGNGECRAAIVRRISQRRCTRKNSGFRVGRGGIGQKDSIMISMLMCESHCDLS